MSAFTELRSLPRSVRLLLANQCLGNIGFFMLVPFLADYLRTDLALSVTVVGIVLGVRNLSQQGLFLVGGSAADRLGARGVIIVGAGIRAVGFALFAIGGSLLVVLAGSVLTGFAGALFNPAVRAYIARDSEDRAAQAFAWFNVFGNAGCALGPVIGTVLVGAGFRITALTAAAVFAGLTVAQLLLLPNRPVPPSGTTLRADFATVFTDRRFWAFSLALAGLFALQSQLYLLFTLQARDLAGAAAGPAAVAALFVVETVAVVVMQVPVTRVLGRRGERGPMMAAGMALLGAAFLPVPLAAAGDLPAGTGVTEVAVRIAPVLLGAVVLALGVTVAQPFVNEAIPRFSGPTLTGTYYGAFYLASGLLTLAAGALVGAVVDHGGGPLGWPPALVCAALGFGSAAAVLTLHRARLLPGPEVSTSPAQPLRPAKGNR
ncbi:MFS transporter [Nocardia sp. NPDC050710]|uniref:MFS transporter n=1 Tax=Nocardia sp. NPDC050710 TaxID=3157220 RepID=UPI0033DE5DE3